MASFFAIKLTQLSRDPVGAHAVSAGPHDQARSARGCAQARPKAGGKARLAGDLFYSRRRLQAVPHSVS